MKELEERRSRLSGANRRIYVRLEFDSGLQDVADSA